jgi:hypothetical protein
VWFGSSPEIIASLRVMRARFHGPRSRQLFDRF